MNILKLSPAELEGMERGQTKILPLQDGTVMLLQIEKKGLRLTKVPRVDKIEKADDTREGGVA